MAEKSPQSEDRERVMMLEEQMVLLAQRVDKLDSSITKLLATQEAFATIAAAPSPSPITIEEASEIRKLLDTLRLDVTHINRRVTTHLTQYHNISPAEATGRIR